MKTLANKTTYIFLFIYLFSTLAIAFSPIIGAKNYEDGDAWGTTSGAGGVNRIRSDSVAQVDYKLTTAEGTIEFDIDEDASWRFTYAGGSSDTSTRAYPSLMTFTSSDRGETSYLNLDMCRPKVMGIIVETGHGSGLSKGAASIIHPDYNNSPEYLNEDNLFEHIRENPDKYTEHQVEYADESYRSSNCPTGANDGLDVSPLAHRELHVDLDIRLNSEGDDVSEDESRSEMVDDGEKTEFLVKSLYFALFRSDTGTNGGDITPPKHPILDAGSTDRVVGGGTTFHQLNYNDPNWQLLDIKPIEGLQELLDGEDDIDNQLLTWDQPYIETGHYQVCAVGINYCSATLESDKGSKSPGDDNYKTFRKFRDGNMRVSLYDIYTKIKNDSDYDAFKAAVGALGEEQIANAQAAGIELGEDEISCQAKGGPLGWFVCVIIEGAVDAMEMIQENLIEPFLKVSPLTTTGSNSPIYGMWQGFRNIALALLIPIFLLLIMAQALSLEFINAYTIRTVLPRLGVAAIGITLSYFIAAIMIDMFNVIGAAVDSLFTSLAPDSIQIENGVSLFGVGLVGTLLTAGGALWLFAGGIGAGLATIGLAVALPALLAVLTVFVTIIVRQLLIIILVIVSPLAMLAYVLPQTERLARSWFSLFLKLLVMYPLIVLLLASGGIFAAIITNSSQNNETQGIFVEISAIFAIILPMFLIGATFKFAGSAIGAVQGWMQNYGQKGIEGIKGSEHDQNSLRNRVKSRRRRQTTQNMARLGDRYSDIDKAAAGKTGLRARGARAASRAMALSNRFGANIDEKMAQETEEAKKRVDMNVNNGKDGWVYAMLGGDYHPISGDKFTDGEKQKAARFQRDPFMKQASLAYAMRKTEDTKGASGMHQLLDRWYDNNSIHGTQGGQMTDKEMEGMYIGAAFANQGTNVDLKSRKIFGDVDPATGRRQFNPLMSEENLDVDKFLGSTEDKLGSYDWSRQHESAFVALEQARSKTTARTQRAQRDHNAAKANGSLKASHTNELREAKAQSARVQRLAGHLHDEFSYDQRGQVDEEGRPQPPRGAEAADTERGGGRQLRFSGTLKSRRALETFLQNSGYEYSNAQHVTPNPNLPNPPDLPITEADTRDAEVHGPANRDPGTDRSGT